MPPPGTRGPRTGLAPGPGPCHSDPVPKFDAIPCPLRWRAVGSAAPFNRNRTTGLSVVCVVALVSGCASPVLHRTSGDASQGILYLSPFLALTRAHQSQTSPDWMYTLSQAYWLNEPELAALTGDTEGNILVNAVSLVARCRSKGLLIGRGSAPDPRKWPDTERFFILTYDRVIFFRTEQEMKACLRENWRISSMKMRPVGEFYEKEKKGRQQGAAPNAGSTVDWRD